MREPLGVVLTGVTASRPHMLRHPNSLEGPSIIITS